MVTRLDIWLVENKKARSRERAKEMIISGGIRVNGKTAAKPSYSVCDGDTIEVNASELKYVGRGGLKLEKALKVFELNLKDAVCVDLGASTGGFTDCMLQNGARKIYAVDVGHGQLDESLRIRQEVIDLEGVNVKDFSLEYMNEKADFVCADLSFISVKNAIPVIKSVLKDNSKAVILIKPQFEVGKKYIGKGGIVKDRSAHASILSELVSFIENCGFTVGGMDYSAVKGGDGNIEYIALLENNKVNTGRSEKADFKALVDKAFKEL